MSAAFKRTDRPVIAIDNVVERMARVLVEHGAFNVTDAAIALLGKWPARMIGDVIDDAVAKAIEMREGRP